MYVLSIDFSKAKPQRLKNIEQNTNLLKELGLWEYARKKPKGKASRKHTFSAQKAAALSER